MACQRSKNIQQQQIRCSGEVFSTDARTDWNVRKKVCGTSFHETDSLNDNKLYTRKMSARMRFGFFCQKQLLLTLWHLIVADLLHQLLLLQLLLLLHCPSNSYSSSSSLPSSSPQVLSNAPGSVPLLLDHSTWCHTLAIVLLMRLVMARLMKMGLVLMKGTLQKATVPTMSSVTAASSCHCKLQI